MSNAYVHGYDPRESERLTDQAGTLVALLHADTEYAAGSRVLEAGCGVGAQTITLAQRSPHARFTSVDVSAESITEAKARIDRAGLVNVESGKPTSSPCHTRPGRSTMCSSASSSSTSRGRSRRCRRSRASSN